MKLVSAQVQIRYETELNTRNNNNVLEHARVKLFQCNLDAIHANSVRARVCVCVWVSSFIPFVVHTKHEHIIFDKQRWRCHRTQSSAATLRAWVCTLLSHLFIAFMSRKRKFQHIFTAIWTSIERLRRHKNHPISRTEWEWESEGEREREREFGENDSTEHAMKRRREIMIIRNNNGIVTARSKSIGAGCWNGME